MKSQLKDGLIDLDRQGKGIKTCVSNVISRKMCLVSKYVTLTISTEIMIAALYSFYLYLKEQLSDIDRKRGKRKYVLISLMAERILSVKKLLYKILYS